MAEPYANPLNENYPDIWRKRSARKFTILIFPRYSAAGKRPLEIALQMAAHACRCSPGQIEDY